MSTEWRLRPRSAMQEQLLRSLIAVVQPASERCRLVTAISITFGAASLMKSVSTTALSVLPRFKPFTAPTVQVNANLDVHRQRRDLLLGGPVTAPRKTSSAAITELSKMGQPLMLGVSIRHFSFRAIRTYLYHLRVRLI